MTERAVGVREGLQRYDLQNSFGRGRDDREEGRALRCLLSLFLLIHFSSHWFLGSVPIDWMSDPRKAHVILVAMHSQGSVVPRHLLDKFICDSFGYVEVFESKHDPGLVPSGGWLRFCCFMR